MKADEPERTDERSLTKTSASARAMGLNDNLDFFGKQLHVQTENIGVPTAHIVTQVFYEGRVLFSRKSGYAPDTGEAGETMNLQTLMRSQHMSVLKEISAKRKKIGHPR
ncbi:MAG TPA: hypothetical protein VLL97_13620 [Acidobacteriota bacterium]|nr:hypothetical protein [Acidobacteriota bacterium]